MSNIALVNESRTQADWLEIVRQKVEGLRYGEIQIIIHDQRVTQIEKTEKTRLQGNTYVNYAG